MKFFYCFYKRKIYESIINMLRILFIFIFFLFLILNIFCFRETFYYPKKIWMYWEQGEENLNDEYLRMCFNGWKTLNPDWNIYLLNKETALYYVPELKKYDWTSVQTRSDILRTKLLIKFGGVWADISTLPLKPLSNNIEMIDNGTGLFFYRYNPPLDGNILISNWFIISFQKNHYLLKKLYSSFTQKLKQKKNQLLFYYQKKNNPYYFIYHFTLTELYFKDKKIKNTIDKLTITQDLSHEPLRSGNLPNLSIENINNLPLMFKRSTIISKEMYYPYIDSVMKSQVKK